MSSNEAIQRQSRLSKSPLSTLSTALVESPIAVYVHIPFCPSKCGYCDFNSYAMQGEIIERTVSAIVREITESPLRGRPAKTIFFGGGTPTYLEETQLLRIFGAVLAVHRPIEGAEITSEANPGTVDMPKFRAMRSAGFNRISLGAQSFLDSDLLTLGRVHKSGEIERAVGAARDAGFENLNLDLMFALPSQSIHGWRQNLERALKLDPEHLSLYCLTIEPNTAYYKLNLKGQLDLPDDEQQVAMYDECLVKSADAGFEQYEISNFSKPGLPCRHNLCYWNADEYAGYGPGAVGSVMSGSERIRYTNLKHPDGYCVAIESGSGLRFECEVLTAEILRVERIMLGLRLNSGLPTGDVCLAESGIKKLLARGWIDVDQQTVRLQRTLRASPFPAPKSPSNFDLAGHGTLWAMALRRVWTYDLAREQAPSLDHLRRFCDVSLESGYDALGLYLEDRFAYPSTPWAHGKGCLTPEMVRTLQNEYPNLQLIPFVNLLGHFEGNFLCANQGSKMQRDVHAACRRARGQVTAS